MRELRARGSTERRPHYKQVEADAVLYIAHGLMCETPQSTRRVSIVKHCPSVAADLNKRRGVGPDQTVAARLSKYELV